VPVIILTPNLTGADGISTVARLLARACEEVTVLALHEPEDTAVFEGVEVCGAGGRSSRFVAAAVRRAAAADSRMTVITNHLHLAPAALAFAARGASLLTILHGVEAWKPLTWIQRLALDRSERLVAVSAFSRERFLAMNPHFTNRRVDVCHLGLTLVPASRVESDPAPSALIVGRMAADERYKGHDLLLEVWRDVAADVPGAVLRIVGDGDDRPRLQQKAAALNLGDQIVFLGRVSDERLAHEYERCTAVVMPSRGEGFGLVFLEAMRAARGCIGCRGSASEIIVDGENGLVLEPDDRAKLRQAVVRLLRDRSEAAAMGARGRARFLQQFTEDHFRSRLAALMPHGSDSAVSDTVSKVHGV
jgi:phosphatidylinositol alpha-1,6-mannosyltransferase